MPYSYNVPHNICYVFLLIDKYVIVYCWVLLLLNILPFSSLWTGVPIWAGHCPQRPCLQECVGGGEQGVEDLWFWFGSREWHLCQDHRWETPSSLDGHWVHCGPSVHNQEWCVSGEVLNGSNTSLIYAYVNFDLSTPSPLFFESVWRRKRCLHLVDCTAYWEDGLFQYYYTTSLYVYYHYMCVWLYLKEKIIKL